ncbi:hypothetical protein [Secundilactobacillus kimchicus]|uniref:hypothetical protein n=1 Tax=Secundilactobacillus kimchicus TaxID=528209 RepID=UPI0024A88B72|nr:hypothetical protein [Secundilactobacillus kimchicus]
MTETNSKKAEVSKQIDAFMSAGKTRFVKWTDPNEPDEKKAKREDKIIVEDPGIEYAMQAIDLTDVGNDEADWSTLFDLIMKNVLVDPSWTFEELDAALAKTDRTHAVKMTNSAGEKVDVKMVWPGYRKAVQFVMGTQSPSGALKMSKSLADLNEEVLRKENNTVADMEYWNAGSRGAGLGMKAMTEAMNYMADILNRDGFLAKVRDALTFLMSTVRG